MLRERSACSGDMTVRQITLLTGILSPFYRWQIFASENLLELVIGQRWECHVTCVGKVKRTRILLQGPMAETFEKL